MNKSKLEWAAVIVVLGGLGIGMAWSHLTYVPRGTFAVDAEVTRYRVEQLGQRLADADKKGDQQAAAAMFDILNDSMRALNDQPGIASSPLRNCRTALVHVTQGAIAVSEGGRWFAEDRYRAALRDC